MGRYFGLLILLGLGCGDDIQKKASIGTENNTIENSANNNTATTNNSENSASNSENPNNSSPNNLNNSSPNNLNNSSPNNLNNSSPNNLNNSSPNNLNNSSPNNLNNSNSNNQTNSPAVCGDGVVQPNEQCDSVPLVDCEDIGFTGGVMSCSSDCLHDTSGCFNGICGNGVVEDGEVCDDGPSNGLYESCNSDCTGLSGFCGDGVVNGPETCDLTTNQSCPAQTAGTPVCRADCTVDYSPCVNVIATPNTGQIVITELMPDPTQRLDNVGEWFEVVNITNSPLELENCVFYSATSSSVESFVIHRSLVIQPGAFATFARSSDAGFVPTFDYQYALNLNNTQDDLRLECPIPNGTQMRVIDEVNYTAPAPGYSLSLRPPYSASLKGLSSNWCNAQTQYSTGDFGTPGSANPACPPI